MTTWSNPAIEARIRRLEENTSDIRKLEAYLQRSAVRVLVRAGELAWAPAPGLRRWRIMWRGERPLLETKAEVRLGCMPELVALVCGIGAEAAKLDGYEEGSGHA